MTETAITVFEPVKPLVTPDQAKEQYQTFEQIKAALLSPRDYAEIMGKKYVTKSGFRKIAVVFGLSDQIMHEERTQREDDSFMWRLRVQTKAPNGRVCEGVGVCDSRERKFSHVEHDVYATAHTRAKNRAISDMVAGGLVSAEEMGAAPTDNKPRPWKRVPVKTTVKPPYAEQVGSAEDDPDVETVLELLQDRGLRIDRLILVKKDSHMWIQHQEGITQDVFNDYNDVLNAELGAKYHRNLSAWEVEPTLPKNSKETNTNAKKAYKD